MNRTLSRREKKKTTDGVTLTGINQTGDQALQNKPSRWVQRPPPLGPQNRLGCPQLGLQGSPQCGLTGTPMGICPDAPWAPEFCWAGPLDDSGENHHPLGAGAAERSREGALASNLLWAPCEGRS